MTAKPHAKQTMPTMHLASPALSRQAEAQSGELAKMDLINKLLKHGFALMRFPASLEQQFLLDQAPARRQHFLVSGLLSLIIYNGFLLADYLMARDVFWLAAQLRVLVFTPVAAFVLYVFWQRRFAVLDRLPPAALELIVLSSGLAAAISLAFILSVTRSPLSPYYHVGFMVVIMYGNVVQRLRFWYAAVFSLALVAIHIGGAVMLHSFPERLLWPIVSMVCAAAAFTLTANYNSERDERKRYLLTMRERGLVKALMQAHERLKDMSSEDGLTGLLNRHHGQQQLDQMWQQAVSTSSSVSVLLIDVDHFKRFNERYGHPSGDACLRQIAETLQATCRGDGITVVRYGGEEFMVLLPHHGEQRALVLAEHVRQAVEALQMRHESSSTARMVTVSMGLSSAEASSHASPDQLISAADVALHQAKREGRNRVCAQAL
jgi:diguanylate cyclase (GGDEF)-like protein